jgi:hypothetical protein
MRLIKMGIANLPSTVGAVGSNSGPVNAEARVMAAIQVTRRRLAVALFLGVLACGESPTQPSPGLVGAWELVGYSEAGTPAAATGTAEFRLDGTFEVGGTITYPGEPPDPVAISGTYAVQGDQVELITPDGSGVWTLHFAGEQVSLTLNGSAPPTIITLRRII